MRLAGGLEVSPLGVGAWAWGDRLFWGYDDSQEAAAQQAFNAAVDLGVNLFDTAAAIPVETNTNMANPHQLQRVVNMRHDIIEGGIVWRQSDAIRIQIRHDTPTAPCKPLRGFRV